MGGKEHSVQGEPIPGTTWIHRNGVRYTVLALTNGHDRPETYPRTVVYKGPNDKLWSRPVADWYRSMTPVSGTAEGTT